MTDKDEMEYCMEEELESFRDEHPDMGESHEQIFRYAYAQGWTDRELKLAEEKRKEKELQDEKDSWDDNY